MTPREHALLAGLADGTLDARRRERAGRIPGAAERAARQRRVTRALALGPVAPPAAAGAGADARSRLAAGGARHPVAAGNAWRPAPRLGLVVAGIAAVLVAALVLALQSAPPGVGDAVRLSQLPAQQPAPGGTGGVLRVRHAGLTFPDWGPELGWHATGSRADRLGGRRARTVFYEHHGHRIAYTIVSGLRLDPPPEARRVRRNGVEIALYRDSRHGGHDVALFMRDGRTCVLAGHVLDPDTLVRLAAWRPRT